MSSCVGMLALVIHLVVISSYQQCAGFEHSVNRSFYEWQSCEYEAKTRPCTSDDNLLFNDTFYYFDHQANRCKPFANGVCADGPNQFSNLTECENFCNYQSESSSLDSMVLGEHCTLNIDEGNCTANETRWAAQGLTCLPFEWTGCEGNTNRFLTENDCLDHCMPDRLPTRSPCHLLPNTGLCRGAVPTYFYDSRIGRCRLFVYGGCGGNANRFRNRAACETTCAR